MPEPARISKFFAFRGSELRLRQTPISDHHTESMYHIHIRGGGAALGDVPTSGFRAEQVLDMVWSSVIGRCLFGWKGPNLCWWHGGMACLCATTAHRRYSGPDSWGGSLGDENSAEPVEA
jgi:hypothetical protein